MMLRKSFLFLVISLWTILLFWPGLYGPFLLDDLQSIDTDQNTPFTWTDLIANSLQNETGPIGRPISVFTFLLNDFLFGPDPFYYKAVNLGIHLLCGLFVGIFIYRLISSLPDRRKFAYPTALLTAVLWLIHPLQVSTVLYAVQRMTQLSALFTLIGLSAYIYGRQSQQKYIYISLFIFFPLAVLSKETGLLFPFYLFIIEYFILDFQCRTPEKRFYLTHSYRIFCLLMILGSLFYFYQHIPQFFSTYHEKDLTLLSRLMTESRVLVFYLSLMVNPLLSRMGLFHDDFIASQSFDFYVILSMGILAGLVFCIFYFRRRAPIISFGLAWFFVSHLIESTFIPLELVFEHRNYLALIGILLIPSYYLILFKNTSKKSIQSLISLLIFLFILMLSFLTFIRSTNWASANNFLKEAYIYHPGSIRAHIEMGNWYLEHQNYSLAVEELNQAAKLQPDNVGILLHRILIGCQTQVIPEQLYKEAEDKIKRVPLTPYPMMVLDQIVNNKFHQQCKAITLDHLETIFKSALKNPNLLQKPKQRAPLYHLYAGVALMKNDVTLCRALLLKSFQSDQNRLDPLIEKATIEWHYKLYEAAHETRELINKHDHFTNVSHKKLRELDQLLKSRKTP